MSTLLVVAIALVGSFVGTGLIAWSLHIAKKRWRPYGMPPDERSELRVVEKFEDERLHKVERESGSYDDCER